MKQTKTTRLSLGKVTIQDLTILESSDLEAVRGGSVNVQGVTDPPIYCY